jgi:hypothetical protein
MTANEFRSVALGFPGVIESAHMNHPDFRFEGSIFASLGYPDEMWGMVALTPEQQRSFIDKAPDVFSPCRGAWGRAGATGVQLALATKTIVRPALQAAYQNICEKVKKKKVPRKR